MKTLDIRALMLPLRAWMDEDESGRNADRVAALVYEKALSGHFGFFKLLIDLLDGKLHQTAEDQKTFETEWAVVLDDEDLHPELANAA